MSRQIINKKRAARNTEVSVIHSTLSDSIIPILSILHGHELYSFKATLETLNNIGFKSTVYNVEDKEYGEQNYPRKTDTKQRPSNNNNDNKITNEKVPGVCNENRSEEHAEAMLKLHTREIIQVLVCMCAKG